MRTVSADCRAETGPKCKHNNDDDLTSLKLYLHVRLRLKIDPTALPAHLPFCQKLAIRQLRQ